MPEEPIILTKALRIATTYRCNLSCPICYAHHSEIDMDDELFIMLLNQGKDLGFESVAFGGGEALLNRNQLLYFLRQSRDTGYLNSVTTSGSILTPQYLDALVDAGLNHLQLSLGYNRTNFPKKVKLLNGTDTIQWGINFVIDPRRISILPAIHRSFENTDCRYIVYIIPRVGNDLVYLKFTYDQIIRYIMTLSHIQQNSDKLFFVDCVTGFLRHGVCRGLESGVSISADGKISMCGYCNRWIQIDESLKNVIDQFNTQYVSKKCLVINQCIRKKEKPSYNL